MGRKALVEFSFIKEICENLKSNQKKFKGQLDPNSLNGSTKAGKKTKAIKRLLVSASEKKIQKEPDRKKREKTPERFTQNSAACDYESTSDSTTSESEDTTSDLESETDNQLNSDDPDRDSDLTTDANGEIE